MSGTLRQLIDSLTGLQKQNAKLERMYSKLGSNADTVEFRDILNKELKSITSTVKSIVESIRNQQRTVSPADKPLLAEQNELFINEYSKFQQLTREIEARQTHILAAASKSVVPDSQLTAELNKSEQEYKRSGVQINDIDDIQFIEYNVQEIEQRQKQIKQIERDVLEVAEMYRDLQQLVNEQQESIDIIENNVQSTYNSTSTAHKELEAAAEYQRQARKKKAIIILILLCVIGIIIGIAVGVSKK